MTISHHDLQPSFSRLPVHHNLHPPTERQKEHTVHVRSLARRLKDVSHGKSPVGRPLLTHAVSVIRVPVKAELGEPEQLEDGLGLPVDLRLLPFAVRRLGNERLKAEPGGDGGAGQGGAVLVSDVHPGQQSVCLLTKHTKNPYL